MRTTRKQPPVPGEGPAVVESFRFQNRIYELRRNSCGKKNCATCDGVRPAHGPYWYLCVSCRRRWTRIYLGKDLDTRKFVNEDGTIAHPAGRTLRPEEIPPPGLEVDEPGQQHLFELGAPAAQVLWVCSQCATTVHEGTSAHGLLLARQRCPFCSAAADVSLIPPRLPGPDSSLAKTERSEEETEE